MIKKGWIKILDSQKEDGSWETYGIDKSDFAIDKNYYNISRDLGCL